MWESEDGHKADVRMEYPEHSDPDGEEEKARAPKGGVSTSDSDQQGASDTKSRRTDKTERDSAAEHSSIQQKRSHCPVPSCVSMKCDQTMDRPLPLAEGGVLAGQSLIQQKRSKRSHSPVPSCVSMKSDQSMGLSLRLAEGGVPTGQRWTPEEAKLRSTLKRKFQHLVEGVPNQGDARLLHEIYTELYITEGGRGEVNDEHEVRQIERASWRQAARGSRTEYIFDSDSYITEGGRGRPIKCNDIFTPLTGRHKPIRRVLTKGVAGIGKTVIVQKFILDWAEEKANQDVHCIFPLPFRELNLKKKKKLSLVELIQHFFPEIKDPRIFTGSEHRVMFIFDGLDECRLLLDFDSNPRCCDVTEPASVDVLLTNLIKGNLLPSALLWITTRPAAANPIPPECVDRVTEIRGFNDPEKEEYFRKRISDENLANRTITHLKSSRSLYIMCNIPVFCWIAAIVLEKILSETGRGEIPISLTQMYTHFLIVQTSTKKEKYTERTETDEEMIFKLGKLAFQQLEKGHLIFYEEDLRECGIDVTEASVYSGVCTQIFREEAGWNQVKVFSFVHLSIQEFLAALYVFLYFSNRERNMPDQQQTSQPSALFRAATLHDLHETAVDLALQSENGHLDHFLRFLLGLSLESNQNLLRHLLPQTRSQSQSLEQTVQCVKQMILDLHDSDRRINLFFCLNELNHHAVVEVIDRRSGTLCVNKLLPGEWRTGSLTYKISEVQQDDKRKRLLPVVKSAFRGQSVRRAEIQSGEARLPESQKRTRGAPTEGQNSSQTVAPSLSNNQVGGDVNITTHIHVQPSPAVNTDSRDYGQPSRSLGQVGIQEAVRFVDKKRAKLISRVTEVMPIADELLDQEFIGRETYSNIQAAPTSEDKMRVLYEGLHSAGAQGKLAFYGILQAKQHHLVEDLWTA